MARSIARALRLDEDLAEAVALAHDLGHTPFGHAGERVLHEKMARVRRLRPQPPGAPRRHRAREPLRRARRAQPHLGDARGHPQAQRPGRSLRLRPASDLEPQTHAGLEAQVAAIADDIAYDAHDIDDALRAGLIALADLADVPLVGPIVREVERRWPDLERRRQAHEVQRRLITAHDRGRHRDHRRRDRRAPIPASVEDVRAARPHPGHLLARRRRRASTASSASCSSGSTAARP